MHKYCLTIFATLASGLMCMAHGQDIQSTPTVSQTITQPSGTSFSVLGSVGIGTTTPLAPLDVSGDVHMEGTLFQLADPSSVNQDTRANYSYIKTIASTFNTQSMTLGTSFGFDNPVDALSIANGSIGVGVIGWPQDRVSINGGLIVDTYDVNDGTNMFLNTGAFTWSNGITFGDASGEGIGSARVQGSVNYNGLDFYTGSIKRLSITQAGNVGIGTATPGQSLQLLNASGTLQPYVASGLVTEVAGTLALSTGQGGSILFQDGTIQSTAWNGTTLGGDYAEAVDVLGDRATYEPGDVIVIADDETGKFDKSSSPYSKFVAGVFSTKPGLVGRRTTIKRTAIEEEIPMALMGIVPVKASTENGPICRGDLLVSSSTPGYAMKGTDRDRLTGSIIGKALAPLKSGSGLIEVLLVIQ